MTYEEWSKDNWMYICNSADAKVIWKAAEKATAERCCEMALWPQSIDDEQAYYGRMFAEFIEREFSLDKSQA